MAGEVAAEQQAAAGGPNRYVVTAVAPGRDRDLAGTVAVVALGAPLVDVLDRLVADDQLVGDGVGVAEHEPDGLAGADVQLVQREAGVVHGELDGPLGRPGRRRNR